MSSTNSEPKSILKSSKLKERKEQEQRELTKRLLSEAKSRIEFDNLVLEWIERLMDPVSEEILKESQNFLRKTDYNEVVKERHLVKLCGYPTCSNSPKKQTRYRIEGNKMLRYGGLNYYCSKDCFLASCSFMLQLSEEPLWIRERARELMQMRKNNKGLSDEELFRKMEDEKLEHVRSLLEELPLGSKSVVGEVVEHPPHSDN
ncbi:RNA polymerase II-associated protein Rtr1 [Schizosaccharomyces japonicus yFS275]|uniref:RNA polymerase II subunit B1 CTD phosphatase RPAP2 homolog n=1 Tax=Schizosaccharomyces japonicus (strain yFS275 / FY16936) TaxID=402676 RepID=B6K1U1_SCHJY|nr:RNA polymerase II-associated protein Rtr1 [Schizosaccharomyces japonicus yFS275]EEB07122.1 RNA polymerase II-associated protein Rtr1 [Schizosaccharomyces japonicus yFS275]